MPDALAAAVVGAILLAAAARSLRLAAAEQLYFTGRAETIRWAIRLEPRRALYWLGLAEMQAINGEDPRPELRAAVRVNPHDAGLRVRLALEAEAYGDFDEAKAQLLAAARMSHKYLPRWTLAGYCFRRGDAEGFWRWAREALQISPRSPEPLFELCWRLEPDPETILARAIPEQPEVKLAFAEFLVRRGRGEYAARLAPDLLEQLPETRTPRLLGLVDAMISARQVLAALDLWDGLCRLGKLPWTEKGRASIQWITNPEFTRFPSGRGFDWRLKDTPGVYCRLSPGGGLRMEFTGRQPEQAVLLHQLVPAPARGRYRFRCRYDARSAPDPGRSPVTGIRWRIWSVDRETRLLKEGGALRVDANGSAGLDIKTPAETRLLRIELIHHREPGTARFRGRITLRRVTLELREGVNEP